MQSKTQPSAGGKYNLRLDAHNKPLLNIRIGADSWNSSSSDKHIDRLVALNAIRADKYVVLAETDSTAESAIEVSDTDTYAEPKNEETDRRNRRRVT